MPSTGIRNRRKSVPGAGDGDRRLARELDGGDLSAYRPAARSVHPPVDMGGWWRHSLPALPGRQEARRDALRDVPRRQPDRKAEDDRSAIGHKRTPVHHSTRAVGPATAGIPIWFTSYSTGAGLEISEIASGSWALRTICYVGRRREVEVKPVWRDAISSATQHYLRRACEATSNQGICG